MVAKADPLRRRARKPNFEAVRTVDTTNPGDLTVGALYDTNPQG